VVLGKILTHVGATAAVIAITRVKSDEEAIDVANDSDYSLAAAVFSKDVLRAIKVGRELRSGSSHVNGCASFTTFRWEFLN
jgi:acyl-CoA reductase-like NAD-dependent aldehyde dehydrogenase